MIRLVPWLTLLVIVLLALLTLGCVTRLRPVQVELSTAGFCGALRTIQEAAQTSRHPDTPALRRWLRDHAREAC